MKKPVNKIVPLFNVLLFSSQVALLNNSSVNVYCNSLGENNGSLFSVDNKSCYSNAVKNC